MDSTWRYPLRYPSSRSQYRHRRPTQTKKTFAQIRDAVFKTAERLRLAHHVYLSSNVPLLANGLPSGTYREPDDPGVALYFVLDGRQRIIACDYWDKVKDNLLEVLEYLESYVALKLSKAKLDYLETPQQNSHGKRYRQDPQNRQSRVHPKQAPSVPHWSVVLGVSIDAEVDIIKAAYKRCAKFAHPDAGGNHDAMAQLNAAYEQAIKEKGQTTQRSP